MHTVIGASIHSGWAELVAVGTAGGAPVLQARWRAALTRDGVPSQPYHHEALRMDLADAEALVRSVRQSVRALVDTALARAVARFDVTSIVFERSPYDALPDTFADIMASWALTCAADGMMYRETVAERAAALGIDVVRYPRKVNVVDLAAARIGADKGRLEAVLGRFGASVGPPWRVEHRHAAAAALMVLAATSHAHPPGQFLGEP